MTRINVTQDDIDTPIEGPRCRDCPVARAMSRALRRTIIVSGSFWRLATDDAQYIPLPKRVSDMVKKFDRNNGMEPFEFDVPD